MRSIALHTMVRPMPVHSNADAGVKSFEQAEYSPDVLGRGVRPVGTNLTAIKSRFATHCMMEGSCPITGGSG